MCLKYLKSLIIHNRISIGGGGGLKKLEKCCEIFPSKVLFIIYLMIIISLLFSGNLKPPMHRSGLSLCPGLAILALKFDDRSRAT